MSRRPAHITQADIARAIRQRRSVIYTPWFWRIIMGIIKTVPEVDPERVGIMGWSRGGFITSHVLFRDLRRSGSGAGFGRPHVQPEGQSPDTRARRFTGPDRFMESDVGVLRADAASGRRRRTQQ